MSVTTQTTKLTPEQIVAEVEGANRLAGGKELSAESRARLLQLARKEIDIDEYVSQIKAKLTN